MAAIPIALPIVWLAALVLFAVAEAATVSLVSIWFAGGALIAFLVSLFTNSLLTQCIVFLAVSALCLALVRPVARKHFSPRLRPTNADPSPGRRGRGHAGNRQPLGHRSGEGLRPDLDRPFPR